MLKKEVNTKLSIKPRCQTKRRGMEATFGREDLVGLTNCFKTNKKLSMDVLKIGLISVRSAQKGYNFTFNE